MKTKNTEKEIKQYLKKIKTELPFSHVQKKKLFSQFENDVWTYYHSASDITLSDIHDEFGSDEEIVHSFIDTLSPESIIKHYKVKKILVTFIIFLLLLLVIWLISTEVIAYMGLISKVEITTN